jgi:hypothetical protein
MLCISLLGLVLQSAKFFSPSGVEILSPVLWKSSVFLCALFFGAYFLLSRFRIYVLRSFGDIRLLALPEVYLVGFLLFLLSEAVSRSFGFYPPSLLRNDFLWVGAASAAIMFLIRHCCANGSLFALRLEHFFLLLIQLLLACLFIEFAHGRMLFSDDHPSFYYRLILLKDYFPSIPFYNTDWNAGYSAREFFPSGVLNFFFLVSPILYALPDFATSAGAHWYTVLIAIVFIGIVPWAIYAAGRMIKLSTTVSSLSAVIAIGASTGYYEWLLKYGTIGFSLSVALLPLTFALCYRVALEEEKPSWSIVLTLLVVSSLALCWTLSSLVLLPILIYALIFYKRTFAKDRLLKIVIFAVLFSLLNGPWILTFITESKVGSFLSGASLPGSHATHFASEVSDAASSPLKAQFVRVQQLFAKVNPLLVFFAVPGLLLFSRKLLARVLGTTLVWLLFCVAVIDSLKPQLELKRMILPAAYLAALPAGIAIDFLCRRFLSLGEARSLARVPMALGLIVLCGGVVATPLTTAAAFLNRSHEKYRFAEPEVWELADSIAEHGGAGRVFFSGFILHELGQSWWAAQDGGHIAPLAYLSGKPMYAFDYYHRRWSTVDPIPLQFRKEGSAGIERFLDLINATSVITHKREWVDYCQKTAGYTEVDKIGRFRIFKRHPHPDGYLQSGDAQIKVARNYIVVTPRSPRLVLKFRYHPRISASPSEGVRIFPVDMFTEEVGGGRSELVQYVGIEIEQGKMGKRLHLGF